MSVADSAYAECDFAFQCETWKCVSRPAYRTRLSFPLSRLPPDYSGSRRLCLDCHSATAHGDDGPDLHDLGFTDDWIANRIRKGKAGEMTAFAGKLQSAEIAALVAYVQSLK